MLRKNRSRVILSLLTFVLPFLIISTMPIVADEPSDFLHLNKEAVYNSETNQIDYVLSSYSTGLISQTDKVLPTDIVLVLDQSGSMNESFGVGNKLIKNGSQPPRFRDLYDTRSNLYYYDANSEFIKLTVERGNTGNDNNALYTLKKANGDVVESGIGSTSPNNPYYQSSVPVTRLDALVSSVSVLVTDTYRNAALHGVDHRISILGFSFGSPDNYRNTEILTTNTGSNLTYKAPGTNTAFENGLTNSLMDVTTVTNQSNIRRAIYSIKADGWTYTSLGVEMGKRVLEKHPVVNQERSQALIVFTDGEPNGNNDGSATFQDAANSALVQSEAVKEKNIPVYSVAIYPGTNPSTLVTNTNFNSLSTVNKVNKFLHFLSSNYSGVTSVNTNRPTSDNGFYKVANTADDLINIFESISETVTTPSTNLDHTASLVDVVSPEFILSSDTVVGVYTQDYLGGDPENEDNWGPLVELVNAVYTVVDDRVTVSNYDYAANYLLVSDEGVLPAKYGNRLVVKFSADVLPGFLGGNEVVTNTVESGIYIIQMQPQKRLSHLSYQRLIFRVILLLMLMI